MYLRRKKSPVGKLFARLCAAVFAVWAMSATAAQAQTVNQYTIIDGGGTNDITGATTCAAPLVQNFSVPTSYTVSDVDIGVFASHSWRGDMRMTLQSPAGTRVQIVNGNTGLSVDNFNKLLGGQFGNTVNGGSDNATDSLTPAPTPYQRNVRPNNALSAFNGQNSLGTWRLEICDLFPSADNGNFQRADLFLTQQPTNYADLSLNKTVSNSTPANGTAISYTLQVSNAASSPNTATGVVVNDLLPAGVIFVSATGFGSYNNATGDWTVGTIAPGQTRTLTINATVNATSGATVTNSAEVTASSHSDIDSTVNNGSTGEDDDDTASFTVSGTRVAGTPPTLICPAGNTIFDWNTRAWTSGATNTSYTVTNIGSINFAISTDGTLVAPSPDDTSDNTGGFGTTQQALYQFLEATNINQTVTTVLTLPTAVPALQFTVLDIDFANNDFADKLTVTGSFNGTTVLPELTNGVANYVTGNIAIGDAGSGGTSADGNVWVTFDQPVDTVTIIYGNHTTAPADPDGQAMSIYDFNFCNPQTSLGVTKVSQVISDPANGTTDPKAIPGAVMQYCILIANAGSATATNVSAADTIPANVTYSAGTMQSGSNCSSATTAEDDDATGADESDPFGASISGTALTASAASLGPSENFALTFQVTVD